MKKDAFIKETEVQIISRGGATGSDFRVGRLELSKHFGTPLLASVDVDPSYAKQLLLQQESSILPGWAPLFLCQCCGDLQCGAISVYIEETGAGYIWSSFRYSAPGEVSEHAPLEMERTGPFVFQRDSYRTALLPYT